MAMVDKTFSEALTFTRATPKWVWNASGQLVEVPVDQPAYDHDPLTGEALGVLIEPGATNYASQSEDLTGISLNGLTAENGSAFGRVTTAFTATTEEEAHYIRPYGVPTEISACYSYAIRPFGGLRYIRTGFRGGVSTSNNFTVDLHEGVALENYYNAKVEKRGEWVFIEFSRGAGAGISQFTLVMLSDAQEHVFVGSGEGFELTMLQMEEGPVATSYIPTNGAAVTRAADSMSRTLGAEFNPSAGTIFIEYESPRDASGTYGRGGGLLFRLYDSSRSGSNQSVAGRFTGRLRFSFVDREGVDFVMNATGPSLPYGQKNKIAICYNSGVGLISAVNGVSDTHAQPELPSVNWSDMSLTTAYDGTTFLGHKSDVRYYPYAMTAAELEALTAL